MKLNEFELIKTLTEKLVKTSKDLVVGIGDDAAVVKRDSFYEIISSDALVEDVHYKREWKDQVPNLYYYLGRKLLTISVSDIASMGGVPEFSVINLGVSLESCEEDLVELYEGLSQACKDYGVTIIGGDTVSSATEFFDSTVFGKANGYLLRSNAKPGDLVAVSGTLGDSKAGLEILLKREELDHYLVERFLNPQARVEEGKEALSLGIECATDVSDSFVFNLYTIAESSGVGIKVFEKEIPISESLVKYAKEKALHFALYGGEDYEIVITFKEKLLDKIEKIGFKVVGEVVNEKGVFLDERRLEKKGFLHF
ncbi:MAG: thiamine-phosphate kinase [Desulfurobacteriaceae bacterium]